MKNKKITIIILILLIFLFISTICFSLLNMGNSNIISGVYINNIDVSNMSKETAKSTLSDYITKKNKTEIKLVYTNENQETYEKNIDLSILNLDYNLEENISEAYNLGRVQNIIQNNFIIAKTLIFKKHINSKINFDEKMLDTVISDISGNLPKKLVQSSYYIENKNLIITTGKPGYIVDKEALYSKLLDVFENFSNEEIMIQIPTIYENPEPIDLDQIHSEIYKEAKNAYFEKDPFKVYAEVNGVDFDLIAAKKLIQENPSNSEYTIKLNYTKPKIKLTNLDINVFPDKIATFSTRYDVSNEDRSNNLNIAASKINGTILSPNEEFSYNKIVGERSISAGYKEAKIYQGGKIVDGIGGGICQISSTLYNAVIFANLKVTQRFNHQFITSYVSAGRDATVVYGVKDFRFINNRTYPIKINISVNSGIAKVDIYGIKEENEYQIDFEVETISNIPYDTKEQIDSSLSSGTELVKQRGADGAIVNVYKIVKQNGITVTKELLSKDKYNSLERIILKSSN